MEQSLLPPSQTRLTSMSIDSRFADQYYHGTSDFMIRLPSTMRNCMRIALSSIELPEVAYVFTGAAGNTCFSVDGTVYDISEGTYTADQLASAMTLAAAGTLDCSYNSITNRFSLSASADVSVVLACPDPLASPCAGPCPPSSVTAKTRYWGLGYNMGFRITYDKVDAYGKTIYDATQYPILVGPVGSVGSVVACQSPQIAPPAYTLLQVRCPDMMENTLHRTAAGSYVQALAKLVLRRGEYQIQFDDAGNMLRKENVFQSPTSLTQLRISLVDSYGNLVEMGDTDWSMTFEIMEIVSSCQYNDLNRAYARC